MKDRPLSATHAASAACWIAGFALAVTYCFTEIRGLGVLGILLAAAGATLTVRGYVVYLAEIVQDCGETAFKLGIRVAQETGSDDPPPRRLR